MINYRIANISDIFSIAQMHYKAAKLQNGAFMHKLGRPFLVCYYLVLLTSKKSFVLIAEKINNEILGFHSGTIDMAYHRARIKKFAILFILAIIPAAIFSPKLIYESYIRYRSISNNKSKYNYSVKTGARGDYWCWISENDYSRYSAFVFFKWLSILKVLSIVEVVVEADEPRIVAMHIRHGAKLISENYLNDGRKRSVLLYQLKDLKR
jgi:hypothetical protein